MEHELKGIRYQSKTYARLETLMNRVNEEAIEEQHQKQKRKKTPGTDGMTKDEYGRELNRNATELIERMKKFRYRPQPVRRTYIPKTNGKMRPLGIPAYEDRLVQGAMADILNDIYEERFLDCSFGFRPERSAHDAVRYIHKTVMTGKVSCVLEADIKGFFDNVDHGWLMKFLENDIADKNFLRYVKRFLIAGVMEGTEYRESEKGTPQGGLISPVLANVYLHYVLDLWYEKVLKKRLKGEVYYVRYADDFLLIFQYENEAKQVMDAMNRRLKKFGLETAEDKTRILPFGRFKGTKEDFDFLGFTFFNAKTKNRKYRLGVRTSKKKLQAKKQAVKAWLKTRLTKPVSETMELINKALAGHGNYYGVNGNFPKLQEFWKYVYSACYKMLNRRHQKKSMSWETFNRIWNYYVKRPHLTTQIWDKIPMLV
jgi:group II intron reverse transcriptase/maturase